MTDTAEITRNVVDGLFEAVRKSQELALAGANQLTDAVRKVTRELPDAVVTPFTDRLPQPGKAVDAWYDIVERGVASQREFAYKLFTGSDPAPAATTKGTSRTATGAAS